MHEKWDPPAGSSGTGYGEYAIVVDQRYVVEASGKVAGIDKLKSAVRRIDVAKLASLQSKGARAD